MRKILLLTASLCIVFALSCVRVPQDKECRYLSDEDAYQSYDASDGMWRYIMLPGTELGMTIRVFPIDTTKKPAQTPSKKGHPLRLEEIDSTFFISTRICKCFCGHNSSEGSNKKFCR